MTTTATVLLVFVFFLGESFAGYSTGLRRTPKPNNPDTVVRPLVYPSVGVTKDDPLWKEQPDHSVEIGKLDDKTDHDEPHTIDETRINQGKENPEGNTKITGSHTGSSHWIAPYDESPAEEKKVPLGIPEVPDKNDEGGIDKIYHGEPDTIDKIGIDEEKQIPEGNGKAIGGSDHWVPSHDDSSAEEKRVPYGVPEVSGKDDVPLKLDDVSIKEEKHPYIPDEVPPKEPSIHVEEKQQEHIPDTEYRDSDSPEKIPQSNPDIPKSIEDEKVPIIPHGVSHPDKIVPGTDKIYIVPIAIIPGSAVGDESNLKDTDERIYPETKPDEEGAVAIGPLPYPEPPPVDIAVVPPGVKGEDDATAIESIPHPPRDTAVIPPGFKQEVLEPYPIKVGAGNGNINLYELMEKLELSRFLHLVEEANLKDLLTGDGPLTIFAPSDFALSKLNADTIRKLATNQELLRQFVLYHCVDGQIYGSSFEERDNSAMTTKFDRSIHINRYGEVWYVNGIAITSRDQTCSNGVIHVLDNSLYPFPTGDLLETLEKLENFKIYTELIRNAKLDKELKGEVVYTIFAPTDVAFSKLPPANLEWLKWDIPAIKRLFRQLTVNGMYYTTWIPSGNGKLSSIDEETTLSLSGYPDSVKVNGVELSEHDITASNGCIHAIDDIWFLSALGTPSESSQKKHD